MKTGYAGWRLVGAAVAVASVLMAAPQRTEAFGAMAIGETGDIVKGGVAVGVSRNYPSRDAAENRALKECLAFEDAPAATRQRCRIVATFERECYAVALDPKPGTPGFGWSVRQAAASADDGAMDQCRRSAGKSRQKFCKITVRNCDETNAPSN